MGHTGVALPKVVRLCGRGGVAGEFPVDFVLDIAHGDESDNNTPPTTGLH